MFNYPYTSAYYPGYQPVPPSSDFYYGQTPNLPPRSNYSAFANDNKPSVEQHAELVNDFLKNISRSPKKKPKKKKHRRHSGSKTKKVGKYVESAPSPGNYDPENTPTISSISDCSDAEISTSRNSRKRLRSSGSRSSASYENDDLKSLQEGSHRRASSERSHSTTRNSDDRSSQKKISLEKSQSKSSRSLDSKQEAELSQLREEHDEKLKYYLQNPSVHPKYNKEKEIFYQVTLGDSLEAPSNIADKFKIFFHKLLEETFSHSWKETKKAFLSKISSKVVKSSTQKVVGLSSKISLSSKCYDSKVLQNGRRNGTPPDKSSKLCNRSLSDDPTLNSSFPMVFNEAKKVGMIPDKNGLSEEVFYLVKTLKELGSWLGIYEEAITHLFMQFSQERDKGTNLCRFIDKDAEMFFTVIKNKLESCLNREDASFIQKTIIQQTLDDLNRFTIHMKEAHFTITLDITKLAQDCKGKSCVETVNFIKEVLSHKKIVLKNDKLMECYLLLTNYQAKSITEKVNPDLKVSFIITPEDRLDLNPESNSTNFETSFSNERNVAKTSHLLDAHVNQSYFSEAQPEKESCALDKEAEKGYSVNAPEKDLHPPHVPEKKPRALNVGEKKLHSPEVNREKYCSPDVHPKKYSILNTAQKKNYSPAIPEKDWHFLYEPEKLPCFSNTHQINYHSSYQYEQKSCSSETQEKKSHSPERRKRISRSPERKDKKSHSLERRKKIYLSPERRDKKSHPSERRDKRSHSSQRREKRSHSPERRKKRSRSPERRKKRSRSPERRDKKSRSSDVSERKTDTKFIMTMKKNTKMSLPSVKSQSVSKLFSKNDASSDEDN